MAHSITIQLSKKNDLQVLTNDKIAFETIMEWYSDKTGKEAVREKSLSNSVEYNGILKGAQKKSTFGKVGGESVWHIPIIDKLLDMDCNLIATTDCITENGPQVHSLVFETECVGHQLTRKLPTFRNVQDIDSNLNMDHSITISKEKKNDLRILTNNKKLFEQITEWYTDATNEEAVRGKSSSESEIYSEYNAILKGAQKKSVFGKVGGVSVWHIPIMDKLLEMQCKLIVTTELIGSKSEWNGVFQQLVFASE